MGHTVSAAVDGKAALALLSQQEFDLIAMDMQMPVMDGIEATRILRRQELGTLRHMPIIANTGNAFDEDRRKCFDAGMDGYVIKPVTSRHSRRNWKSSVCSRRQANRSARKSGAVIRPFFNTGGLISLFARGTPNPIFAMLAAIPSDVFS
jgi:CheY-like chemotaxis protein